MKMILLDQNNYVRISSSNAAKAFNILVTSLNVLPNYFDHSTKLFLYSYIVKFLDTSAKPFRVIITCINIPYLKILIL